MIVADENLCRETAARLRKAITSGAYDDAQSALAEYSAQVDAIVAARPPDEPPPLDLVREAHLLARWALRMVRVARGQARLQSDQASAALGYRDPAPPTQSWNIDG
jgi:hypothetical protein